MSDSKPPKDSSSPRREPRLGNIDRIDTPAAPRIREDGRPRKLWRRPKSRKHWPWLTLLLALVGGLGLWLNQDRMRALIPHTEYDDLLTRADQALKQGHLEGVDGAHALYQLARAQEPDSERAQAGLEQVGKAELALATSAFQHDKLDDAQQKLAIARDLLGGGSEVEQLSAQIDRSRARVQAKGTNLLDEARLALADGHLEGDRGAAALYRAILLTDPGNAVAADGLRKTGVALAEHARQALTNQQLEQASNSIDQLAAWLPNDAALPALRAELAKHSAVAELPIPVKAVSAPATLVPSTTNKADVDSLVQRAQQAAATGQIMMPPGANAYDLYRSALSIDGNHEPARQGLRDLPKMANHDFEQALSMGNLARAEDRLSDLQSLSPGDPDQAVLRQRLADAWLDRAEQAQLNNAAGEASKALDHARKLAPDNPRLQTLSTRIPRQ